MSNSHRPAKWAILWLSISAVVGLSQVASGATQDLLNDNITFSGATLNLRPYATLPGSNNDIISMTTRTGDTRMYVTTEEGTIFVINDAGNGNTTPVPWFNAASALQTATGRSMNGSDGQRGLQSVAFHPDFDKAGSPGYGKLYTTMLENRPSNPHDPAFSYLGNSTYGGGGADGVLAEWTYNHTTGQVDANSYRELFRVNMPNYDHPIKQARFNPYAKPGDEDYGLLYMTHGDSNNQDSPNDDPQDRGDVLGKMIRINPLSPSAGVRYSIPTTNPYYNDPDPNVLEEVYAYGFRNPHTFSFNRDDEGNIHILVGDIGRSNVEEVNLVFSGGNYGWPKREGTFIHLQGTDYTPPGVNAGYYTGVLPLESTEVDDGKGPDGNRYIYPVGQYDHNDYNTSISQDYTATAIASGFVIRNGSDPALHNQLIFNNFAWQNGNVYQTDFDEMLGAVTQLVPGDGNPNDPNDLTQAELYRLHLTLDDDNNPNTPALTYDDLNTLISGDPGDLYDRSDSRYGEGVFGEMYISSKTNGVVYLVTNTVPLIGDYNKDGVVDAADYTVWRDSLGEEGYHLPADGDGDGVVTANDYSVWKDHFGQIWPGPASGTGAGLDGAPVPEPSSWLMVILGAAWMARRRRRELSDGESVGTRRE